MKPANIFAGIPGDLPEEIFHGIITGDHLRIERIVSRGHRSPAVGWYEQVWAEWVLVLKGAARLEFEDDGEVALGPGDHVCIDRGRRHRVAWTDPGQDTVWLAVHFGEAALGENSE
ncbi:MAG: cupin domain-containing protein [Gammaproteobacteria bacterium]|nr:cupin domain-containing protein [Gammaproteobacteria bacterium]